MIWYPSIYVLVGEERIRGDEVVERGGLRSMSSGLDHRFRKSKVDHFRQSQMEMFRYEDEPEAEQVGLGAFGLAALAEGEQRGDECGSGSLCFR